MPSPRHLRIHPVIHFLRTVPYVSQPAEVGSSILPRLEPVPVIEGKEPIVEEVDAHQRRGTGSQFVTLMAGEPLHDAT